MDPAYSIICHKKKNSNINLTHSSLIRINSFRYISLKDYPYHKFPAYVSAGCFILSQKSAQKFYLATKFNKVRTKKTNFEIDRN